jgi:hypothetical protein
VDFASSCRKFSHQPDLDSLNIQHKLIEIRSIGTRKGADYDIQPGKPGNQPDPNQLSKPTTKLVSLYYRVAILRYYHSNPTIREQGDDHTGLEPASF